MFNPQVRVLPPDHDFFTQGNTRYGGYYPGVDKPAAAVQSMEIVSNFRCQSLVLAGIVFN
jgi:hypothetical protein